MTTDLYALNGKVIIEPITEETTNAGLIVQASQDIKAAKGKIVNVSTLVWNEFLGKFVLMQTGDLIEQIDYPYTQCGEDRKQFETKQTHYISVGDIVIYDKLSAYEAKLDNKVFHIIDRRSILAILKESSE